MNRFDDFGDEIDGVEVEDTAVYPAVDSVPEPAPVEPAPVEPTVDPVPTPITNEECEEFNGETLNRMAAHLRKRERLTISLDDAMLRILTDPATNKEYKKLKDLGKFR